jgi:hypothetical protein
MELLRPAEMFRSEELLRRVVELLDLIDLLREEWLLAEGLLRADELLRGMDLLRADELLRNEDCDTKSNKKSWVLQDQCEDATDLISDSCEQVAELDLRVIGIKSSVDKLFQK